MHSEGFRYSEKFEVVIVGVGVGVAVGAAEGVEVGVATGVGFVATLTAMPLFQRRRVPDLMQVNFFPPEIVVDPAFAHFAPALIPAALSGAAKRPNRRIRTITCKARFFIGEKYATTLTVGNTSPTNA